ncbi:MAG: hypothetical protein JWR16_1190 [Nevskia sp.]|nr:hypothetical protein [Nevskia sp.]
MKKILLAAALITCSVPAFAGVGVSVNVGEPGFFGQIDVGGAPPPQLVYERPVIIQQAPGYDAQPIYLHVRPGYEQNWRSHCAEYGACGRQVYFVRDEWYNQQYVPYRHHGNGNRGDHDHGHDDRHDHDDHRDHEEHHDHGG